MRTLFFSLTALAVALAGCDSGGPDPDAFTGPIVQFGAASASVSEGDGTVEIPVTLSNAQPGQQVTVEVLYAAAASSEASGGGLVYGDDIDNFGTATGANRVATVTLTGPTDTKTVTIDLIEDNEAEAAESALFVLQRASGGARIGANREFRLEIGTPPIAVIRTRELGSTVTVEGIVTRARGRYSFIQDNSGAAIATFGSAGPYFEAIASGAVAQGDRVQIVGRLSEFNSLLQVDFIESFEVISRGNPLPAAQTVTLAQVANSGDTYESEIIRVPGLMMSTSATTFNGSTSYDVTSGGTTLVLRTQRDTDTGIVNEAIQPLTGGAPGAYGPFTFTGPLGQFRDTNQLNPVNRTDLSPQ